MGICLLYAMLYQVCCTKANRGGPGQAHGCGRKANQRVLDKGIITGRQSWSDADNRPGKAGKQG